MGRGDGGEWEFYSMSVAFTREDSAETAAEIELPERPISPHPNLVTEAGLKQLQDAVAAGQAAFEAALRVDDINERRRATALAARDLSYFMERVKTAEVVPLSPASDVVTFGRRVAFQRDDGRRQAYRIVGEDEADPRSGSISYVSPVARALIGKRVGDLARLGDSELEILAIE